MNTQDYELTPPPLMGVMLPPDYDPKEESPQELATIPRKIMPVFFVLDCSGSMTGAWIASLNEAMRNTIEALKIEQYNNPDVDMRIAVLQVNSSCRWLTPDLIPIDDIIWDDLTAGGLTSFGESFNELNKQLSRRGMLQSDTGVLSPIIVFTADGIPTDSWENPLESLKQNRWYRSATKIALGIHDGADEEFLTEIVGNSECVFFAPDPESIQAVFREMMPLFRYISTPGEIDFADYEVTDESNTASIILPSKVETSYGRAKCKMLKTIRKAIADANNIPYEITECHSEGHCNGACPACDKEATEFSKMLTDKAAAGHVIHMPNMDTTLLDEFLPTDIDEGPQIPEKYEADGLMTFDGW